MDASGDCSDDLLQLHYPDEDIPHELIGFLDDKVSSSIYDHLALAEIIVFSQTTNWDRRERSSAEATFLGRWSISPKK